MLGHLMEVILYVEDMRAQVGFYRDKMGLTVKEPADRDDYSKEWWVEFDTGPCRLVLHGGRRRLGEDAPKVVFRVSDIQVARAELVRRGIELGEVRSPAPGVLVVDGIDPEGNKLSIESRDP